MTFNENWLAQLTVLTCHKKIPNLIRSYFSKVLLFFRSIVFISLSWVFFKGSQKTIIKHVLAVISDYSSTSFPLKIFYGQWFFNSNCWWSNKALRSFSHDWENNNSQSLIWYNFFYSWCQQDYDTFNKQNIHSSFWSCERNSATCGQKAYEQKGRASSLGWLCTSKPEIIGCFNSCKDIRVRVLFDLISSW